MYMAMGPLLQGPPALFEKGPVLVDRTGMPGSTQGLGNGAGERGGGFRGGLGGQAAMTEASPHQHSSPATCVPGCFSAKLRANVHDNK